MLRFLAGSCLLFYGAVSAAAATASCLEIDAAEERLVCLEELVACLDLPGARRRLECLEAGYGAEKRKPGKASSPGPLAGAGADAAIDTGHEQAAQQATSPRLATAQNANRAKREADDMDDFGRPSERRRTNEASLVARVAQVKQGARGIDYIYLDNGQVWRENLDHKVKIKPGRQAVIRRGILGSFTMTVEEARRALKVKRVK